MRLQGKVALVTGASKGIGEGVAVRFAQEGADVVVNYNADVAGAERTVKAVEAAGRRGLVVQADVADLGKIQAMFDQAVGAFGHIDILVNNSGVEIQRPFLEVPEKEYDLVLDVNLKGAFFCAQFFAKHCRDTGRPGRVINMSSVHEDLTFPGYTAYCCSKGGMRMLTRNLAVELAPLGITVNGVAPGAIETPINAKLLSDPSRLDPLLAQIPLKRLGQPEDVANVTVFLASDESSYVTGSTYFVDGGLTVFYEE